MARTKISDDDRSAWRQIRRFAEKHGLDGFDDDDDEDATEPRYRINIVEGTKRQLQEMGFLPREDADSGEASEDPESGTEESDDRTETETEPKPKSRNRYFGGR